jgi:CBS domain-containing protein
MSEQRKVVRVRDVMQTTPEVVDGTITVADALSRIKRMDQCGFALIVDKRNDDDEFGIVLLADIARQVLAADRSPERVNIYEIMSKPVISVRPDMDIRYCARMFEQFGLSRAPVIEAGKVIGIISFTDMVLHGLVDLDNES